MKMRSLSRFALVAALALAGAAFLADASAQVPSLPLSPYNPPVTNPAVNTPAATAVITNIAAGTGTYSSNIINNIAYAGALCTYNQTAHTGTPLTTLEIDAYDEASATFQKWVTTGNVSADATPTSVEVYPGASLTTTPTGMVIEALKLPRYFRVKEVVGGSNGSTVTGTVGCDLLR